MIHNFTAYVHDEGFRENAEWYLRDCDLEVTDELIDKIGKPFYEVTLECTLDDETGKVEILKATA